MEDREKFDESIVQFKSDDKNLGTRRIETVEKTVVEKPRDWFGRLYRISRTLRVIEILILVALLGLTIYLLVVHTKESLNIVGCTILIGLFSIYLLILSIETFSQILERSLSDVSMFLFLEIGFALFTGIAEFGIYVSFTGTMSGASVVAVIILCIIEAILFLLSATLLILNWQQAYTREKKYTFGTPVSNVTTIYKPGENYSQKTIRISDPMVFRGDVHDVSTSISDYQRPSHPDLVNLHKYRKIGIGHRRQYVDRPVNAQSAVQLSVIEVQTDPPQRKQVSDVESLIVAEMKEEPAQTTPRCPVCANNFDPQIPVRRQENFGLCPTFLHLAQGLGMCNCSPGPPSVVRPFPIALRTESTSATDLGIPRRAEKPNSRRNSNQERK